MGKKIQNLLLRNGFYYEPFSDTPYNGTFEDYYKDNQLKSKISYEDGKGAGPYELYFENGCLKEKGFYKAGKENGVVENFFENGKLKSKMMFKNGEVDYSQDYTEFYESGILSFVSLERGESYSYFEDGTLKWEEKKDYYKSYFKNGQLMIELIGAVCNEFYENGDLEKNFSINLKMFKEFETIDECLEGPYESYYECGGIKKKTSYKDGLLEGSFISFYNDGALKEKSTYSRGIRIGKYETYGPLGDLTGSGEETNDRIFTLIDDIYENNDYFSSRTLDCLKSIGIIFLGDLALMDEKSLLRIPNFGKKSLNDLKTLINDYGFEFGMNLSEEDIKKLKTMKEDLKNSG